MCNPHAGLVATAFAITVALGAYLIFRREQPESPSTQELDLSETCFDLPDDQCWIGGEDQCYVSEESQWSHKKPSIISPSDDPPWWLDCIPTALVISAIVIYLKGRPPSH